jgi:hypothetical protein
MANYYAIAALAASSGETADVNVNTFAFEAPDVFTPTEGEFVTDAIKAFYDTIHPLGALRGRAQNGHVVKIYAAVTTTPNYPVDENGFNLAGSAVAVDLPLEVNLCVSYACDSAVIVPRARRRGRIYISGFGEALNTVGRPEAVIIEGLADAYQAYCDTINADPDFVACVWSRANASLYPIERVWVDNEWDTMRSRGGKSTSRYTVTVS